MGFGSYDESEQENQDVDGNEIDISDDERINHDGSVEFDNGESTEELIDRLQGMKNTGSE